METLGASEKVGTTTKTIKPLKRRSEETGMTGTGTEEQETENNGIHITTKTMASRKRIMSSGRIKMKEETEETEIGGTSEMAMIKIYTNQGIR